jgi:hypothetical protein
VVVSLLFMPPRGSNIGWRGSVGNLPAVAGRIADFNRRR